MVKNFSPRVHDFVLKFNLPCNMTQLHHVKTRFSSMMQVSSSSSAKGQQKATSNSSCISARGRSKTSTIGLKVSLFGHANRFKKSSPCSSRVYKYLSGEGRKYANSWRPNQLHKKGYIRGY